MHCYYFKMRVCSSLVLLFLALVASASALKGESTVLLRAGRKLQDTVEEVSPRTMGEPKTPKVIKDPKKCKKVKKTKSIIIEKKAPPVVGPAADADVPYCLHGERTEEECSAASRGKVPKDDKKVYGGLSIKIIPYSDDILKSTESVLVQKTSRAFIGCPAVERRLQIMERETTNSTVMDMDEPIEVTGIGFDSLRNEGACNKRR